MLAEQRLQILQFKLTQIAKADVTSIWLAGRSILGLQLLHLDNILGLHGKILRLLL